MSSFSRVSTLFRLQRTILLLLFISFLCGMVLGISLVTNTNLGSGIYSLFKAERQGPLDHNNNDLVKKASLPEENRPNPQMHGFPRRFKHKSNQSDNKFIQEGNNVSPRKTISGQPAGNSKTKQQVGLKGRPMKNDILDENESEVLGQMDKFPTPNYNVHIFYYPWYGDPEHDDGKWYHWNHPYLPHWDKVENKKWPAGRHKPPDDIGSNYYPALGPYSSRDPQIMFEHMKQIRSSGSGVLAVSWYPPDDSDEQGRSWDSLLPQLMDAADHYKLKVCLHIEPYKNRTAVSFRAHLKYLNSRYGAHPAYYRYKLRGKQLPMYYIYDSYLVSSKEWATIFKEEGVYSVRGTDQDGVFIGLAVEEKHPAELLSAGFDGLYTYFASDGFTYGSSTRNWDHLSSFALANNILFIPSVGPGYIDVRIRAWNGRNTKDREHGGYFEQSFKAALTARPSLISVTSFNEWHEGTQIEKAVPKNIPGFSYADYSPQKPEYYLMLARKWTHKFKRYQSQQGI